MSTFAPRLYGAGMGATEPMTPKMKNTTKQISNIMTLIYVASVVSSMGYFADASPDTRATTFHTS